jgi:invasion protein IalB
MTHFTPARFAAALATTSIAALMVSSALAQTQPAPKPAPSRPAASKPAQPAPAQTPQAQPAQPAEQQPPQQPQQDAQLIYSQWVKFCVGPDGQPADQKDAAVKAKQVCLTGTDARLESGAPMAAVVAIEPPAGGTKILRITLPVGMMLVRGTRVIVDQAQPLTAPYVTCFANGCMADYELSGELLDKMKKGKTVHVQGIRYNDTPLTIGVPLTEFAKVIDNPPADPKVLEERQKKLEDELKKKGEELKKKASEARQQLEQGGAKPQ